MIYPLKKSNENNKDKRFWIAPDVFDRIISYAESAYRQFQCEIGGQLVIREDKDGDFILEDPVILKQKISATNCDLDEEALAIHYSKMAGKHGDTIRHCWWHSHHTMEAFWSGTDTNTIESNKSKDFTVSLVVNLKKEYKLRVQFFYPFEHHEDVDLNFLTYETEENSAIDKEVKELCSKEVVYQNVYSKTHKKGGQSALFGNCVDKPDAWDSEEIRQWNYGYGINVDTSQNPDLDFKGIAEKTQASILKRVECIQDDIADGQVSFNKFQELRQKLNQDISQYNVKVKSVDKVEFDTITYHSWPEELLENINIPTNKEVGLAK